MIYRANKKTAIILRGLTVAMRKGEELLLLSDHFEPITDTPEQPESGDKNIHAISKHGA